MQNRRDIPCSEFICMFAFMALLPASLAFARPSPKPSTARCQELIAKSADPLDQRWSTCPDELGCVVLEETGARLPSECLNGLPNALFKGMFWDAEDYEKCRDIFAEPAFSDAISAIRPMADLEAKQKMSLGEMSQVEKPDGVQLRMATVLARLKAWKWTTKHQQFEGNEMFGCCEADDGHGSAIIYLYGGICDARTIYDASLANISPGLRFHLIAAHELGHVMDWESGKAEMEPGARETRATVYGSYFARCTAHRWVEFWDREIAEHKKKPDDYSEIRYCYLERWKAFERTIVSEHKRWAETPSKSPEFMKFALACMAALPSSSPKAQSLDKCPVSPCSSSNVRALMDKVRMPLFDINDVNLLVDCEQDGPYQIGRYTLDSIGRESFAMTELVTHKRLGAATSLISSILPLIDRDRRLYLRIQ